MAEGDDPPPGCLATIGNTILFLVGLALLIVPGGCALLSLAAAGKNATISGSGVVFLAICAALVFAGFALLRSVLK